MTMFHGKQCETKKLRRLCRYCRRLRCISKKTHGVTCHALYMRQWRRLFRIEVERLRITDMASLRAKYVREPQP